MWRSWRATLLKKGDREVQGADKEGLLRQEGLAGAGSVPRNTKYYDEIWGDLRMRPYSLRSPFNPPR